MRTITCHSREVKPGSDLELVFRKLTFHHIISNELILGLFILSTQLLKLVFIRHFLRVSHFLHFNKTFSQIGNLVNYEQNKICVTVMGT